MMNHSKKLSELTEEQSLEETVGMWNWVSEDPARKKEGWPGLKAWDGWPFASCFLCSVAGNKGTFNHCDRCPLTGRWGVRPQTKRKTCAQRGGLFNLWRKAEGTKSSRYARLIAERAQMLLDEMHHE